MWIHRIDHVVNTIHIGLVQFAYLIAIVVCLETFYLFMTKVVALWH